MTVRVVKDGITKSALAELAREGFGDFVKAVVDVEKGIMAIGGELHADEETALMEQEHSAREHTWGINFYPARPETEWLEFDSMINLKPALGNRSRDVESEDIRKKIRAVVTKLVHD